MAVVMGGKDLAVNGMTAEPELNGIVLLGLARRQVQSLCHQLGLTGCNGFIDIFVFRRFQTACFGWGGGVLRLLQTGGLIAEIKCQQGFFRGVEPGQAV